MPRVRFQPLRINKRGWRSTWFNAAGSQNPRRVQDDPEKPFLDADDYETDYLSSNSSSRSSSGSYGSEETLLPEKPSTPASSSAYASRTRSRRKCNRYFTIILGSMLVATVLLLTQMHFHSVRDVALGIHRLPPKPAIWEDFPILGRYFGGVKSIGPASENDPEYPRSKAEIAEEVMAALQNATDIATRQSTGDSLNMHPVPAAFSGTQRCAFSSEESDLPELMAIDGRPRGFPDHVLGIDLTNNTEISSSCTERFGRLGPYGLGYSRRRGGTGGGQEGDRTGIEQVWTHQKQIDYQLFDWNSTQADCSVKAAGQSRTAIVYRTRAQHRFDPEEILALRALLSETALASAGQYDVHLLVEVPEDSPGIWTDENVYQNFLRQALPAEFQGLGTLWSVDQMHLAYGDNARLYHGDSFSNVFAMQHFARSHPEYDFFWNWDSRVRSTGHIGRTLKTIHEWAQEQPMKELWNRNDRFYVPLEHGSWEDFRHMVRVQSEHGSSQKASMWSKAALRPDEADGSRMASVSKPVWGPVEPIDDALDDIAESRKPPTSQDGDHYSWGVGDEADLISLSPIFEPDGTLYGPSEAITGYNVTAGFPPRRATLSGLTRLSKELLDTMHRESLKGRAMDATMWPASMALQYGYKAVYAPQPIYVDRVWPTDYLAAVMNSGLNGAVGGARTSVFDDGRMHNLQGLSWSASGRFGTKLWKRWLGYRVDGAGGEEWEGSEEGEGRMCLPGMMLWPVEGIELIVQ